MSITAEMLTTYYKTLQELYNTTLNILVQLENHNLTEALKIQKNSQPLMELAESMLSDLSHHRLNLSEEAKKSVEHAILLHHRIDLLNQQCQNMIKRYMEELRDKMSQLQKAKKIAESQKTATPAHITHHI